MHRTILMFATGFVYYAVTAFGLYTLDAGLIMTALVLYGLPAALLAYFSYAPTAVLVTIATLGIGVSILLEGVAHIYGLWYTIGIDETRLFDIVPLEMLIASVVQTIFYVLLYELIFDDGRYIPSNARQRFVAIGVFALATLSLLGLHQYVLQAVFLSYSYLWILISLLAAAVAAYGVHRTYTPLIFDRITHFTLLASIPGILGLVLSITNVHKIFANPDQYIGTMHWFGELVPVEELCLVFAIPFFLATVYELYLDDQA